MNYNIYSGAGNDFVMINNLNKIIPVESQKEFTIKICGERFKEIDGVIFVDKALDEKNDIRMNYYNRDGSFGAMCGNGARCIAQFAFDNKLTEKIIFDIEAVDKIYGAEILGNNIVKISFPPPDKLETGIEFERPNWMPKLILNYVDVGSDHIVIFIDDEPNKTALSIDGLDEAKINEWGSELRYDPQFQPKGANINFVQVIAPNQLRIRTYERGVERETLACGTGIISSALIAAILGKVKPPVKVLSQSGEWLTVDFILKQNNKIENLSLEGPAKKIEEGSF